MTNRARFVVAVLVCAAALGCNWWTSLYQDSTGTYWHQVYRTGETNEVGRCQCTDRNCWIYTQCLVRQSAMVGACLYDVVGYPIWCGEPMPYPVTVVNY